MNALSDLLSSPHLRRLARSTPGYYTVKNSVRNLRNAVRRSDHYAAAAMAALDRPLVPVPVKLDRPRAAAIEITNACNLNCRMCNTKMQSRDMGLISKKDFEHLILGLKKVGILSADLHTVGETFVHKGLGDLVEIACRNDFGVGISTNAQFPDKLRELHSRFPFVANSFRFSIDGASKETFEFIRVGASWESLMESLETVRDINHGKINRNISLTIDSILCMANVGEVAQYFEVFSPYVWPEHIRFGLVNGLSPDPSFFRQMLPFTNLVRAAAPCSLPFTGIWFTYDGRATTCCRDYDAELTIGDALSQDVMEIWDGAPAKRMREAQLTGIDLPKPCQNCDRPYHFADTVANCYIHHLRLNGSRLTSAAFGEKILSLLASMDEAMASKDMELLRKRVAAAFRGA
ncbi:MAG: radical SAM protein [Magnetospirillum sp.]|nr:radical SAM protein [Magnetospirillum sp.]